jgi:hypothetical protein
MKTILRVKPDTGELFILDRLDSGKFQVGDPEYASEKGHPNRRVDVETIDEVLEYVARGFSVRLRSLDTGKLSMISPPSLRIVDVPS